jgi:ABC-type branched-subunit amino acid transport system substrate-binding protein
LQKKILAIIAVVIIVIAAFAAWQFYPTTTKHEIKIGLVAPISGQPIGQDMLRAAELAVKKSTMQAEST